MDEIKDRLERSEKLTNLAREYGLSDNIYRDLHYGTTGWVMVSKSGYTNWLGDSIDNAVFTIEFIGQEYINCELCGVEIAIKPDERRVICSACSYNVLGIY